jgi:hypothetical protein
MKRAMAAMTFLFIGLAQAASPTAAAAQAESCDQLRAQIRAHTGLPAKPNTDLLSKVGANPTCRFTSAEAYRAAWGDKPIPKGERRSAAESGSGFGHDDDDD